MTCQKENPSVDQGTRTRNNKRTTHKCELKITSMLNLPKLRSRNTGTTQAEMPEKKVEPVMKNQSVNGSELTPIEPKVNPPPNN